MEILTAASAEDVREFFRKYYAPQNASLVVAGDINTADVQENRAWFSDVKPGKPVDPIEVPPVALSGVVKETLTDAYNCPACIRVGDACAYAPGDAELDVAASVLAGGENSRLTSVWSTTCRRPRTWSRISRRTAGARCSASKSPRGLPLMRPPRPSRS